MFNQKGRFGIFEYLLMFWEQYSQLICSRTPIIFKHARKFILVFRSINLYFHKFCLILTKQNTSIIYHSPHRCLRETITHQWLFTYLLCYGVNNVIVITIFPRVVNTLTTSENATFVYIFVTIKWSQLSFMLFIPFSPYLLQVLPIVSGSQLFAYSYQNVFYITYL